HAISPSSARSGVISTPAGTSCPSACRNTSGTRSGGDVPDSSNASVSSNACTPCATDARNGSPNSRDAPRPSRRSMAGLMSSQRPPPSRTAMPRADEDTARRTRSPEAVSLGVCAVNIGPGPACCKEGIKPASRRSVDNVNAAEGTMPAMDLNQILFLLILAGGLYLFVSERVRIDVSAMLILLALTVTGVLDSDEALSGFASEPAIIVAAVFVISGALAATGITEHIGQWIGRAAGKSEARAIAVTMPAVAAMASFTHHVMVTAMMMPILNRFAKANGLSASRLLMPMSFAASLGTTLTLVSAPAFLLADNLLQRSGSRGLDIFSITPIGIALVAFGLVYMLLARWMLPKRSGKDGSDEYLRLDRYRTELLVVKDSRWNTRPLGELKKALGDRFRLIAWLRDDKRRSDLGKDNPLLSGDVLVVE